jgi:hypothetical protein
MNILTQDYTIHRGIPGHKEGIVILRQHKDKVLLGDMVITYPSQGNDVRTFSMLSQSDFVNKVKNWESTLSKIIGHLKKDSSIKFFVIDDNHEIIKNDNHLFNNIPVFESLYNIFSEHKLISKTYYSDNNLDNTNPICGIKSKPFPYFLGWNVQNNLNGKHRAFKKHFLFLNRINKPHRRWMFGNLIAADLLEYCYWSYDSNNPDSELYKCLGPSEQELGHEEETYSVTSYFSKAFCNIVTETNFNWDQTFVSIEGGFGTGNTFITEKTEKCFSAMMPFVIVGTPFFLRKLHQLGFKTFNKFWSEEYDCISNPHERLRAVFKVVEEIAGYSPAKLISLYDKMLPILKHNQELNNWYWIQGMNGLNLRYPGHTLLDIKTHYFTLTGNPLNVDKTLV